MLSKSNPDPNDRHEPYPWLEEKVYAKLHQRTVGLVRQSVDALLKDKLRVSLATVVAKSREFDERGSQKVPSSTTRRPGPTTSSTARGKEPPNDDQSH